MSRKEASIYLDQLYKSLSRAEDSKKDIDLLIALRICFMLLEDKLKHWEEKDNTK